MSSNIDPSCPFCGEHPENCEHEMTPSLQQQLHHALLASSHGRQPRSTESLVDSIRTLAALEAARIIVQVATIIDDRSSSTRQQGIEGETPFSPGDVAAALRTAALQTLHPQTPPTRR